MFHKENQRIKHSKSSFLNNQHSVLIQTTASNKLINEPKRRSSSLSHSIDQVVGFIQRKISHSNDEEKQEFDDLKKIK